jgi:hypothetical protein
LTVFGHNLCFQTGYALKFLFTIGSERALSSAIPVLFNLMNVPVERGCKTYGDGGAGGAVPAGVTEMQVIVVPVTGKV